MKLCFFETFFVLVMLLCFYAFPCHCEAIYVIARAHNGATLSTLNQKDTEFTSLIFGSKR